MKRWAVCRYVCGGRWGGGEGSTSWAISVGAEYGNSINRSEYGSIFSGCFGFWR